MWWRGIGPPPAFQGCAHCSAQPTSRAAFLISSILAIDAFIEPLHQPVNRDSKHAANAKQRRQCNRSSGFDLLPMPRREAKRDHVFLAERAFFPQGLNSLAERSKELRMLVVHPIRLYRVTSRNTTSRL